MDKQLTKQKNEFLGSGWAFPVTFSIRTLELELTEYEQNINDSIKTILLTNQGERCLESQFGSGLHNFYFKKMDDTLKGEIIDAVETSLLDNEPRITVESVDVVFSDIESGAVEVYIDYIYNQTNTRHNYVFPFYLKEGTSLNF